MMNRGIMQRQMFARGGAAGFPDLSGDGQITQKDILMGRGVKMQMGGEPLAAQQMAAQQVTPDQAAQMPMEAAVGEAQQMGIDPGMMEQFIGQIGQGYSDLDNAESYEEVMNMMRGDEASLDERYSELADMVGEEDARQTPESVLTLVQPVMMMAEVDQGIGGLAQDQMQGSVEGDMAGGIMSTVNMGQEVPTSGNFNQGGQPVAMAQGGAVQYFQPGGVALPDSRLGQLYGEKQAIYKNILGADDAQRAFDEQRRMTQAQMLFDIAQGGLAFATPGDRQMSPAERLAEAFQPVLGNIGARAGELQKFKQAQEAEQRALNLQALGAAESALSQEKQAESAMKLADAERAWKTAENAESRAFELIKLDKQFAFTKQQNESDQDFQTRLADRKLAMQLTIAELQGAQTESQIQLRAQLQQELARLNNEFQLTIQSNQFDFTQSERMAAQDFTTSLTAQKFANDKAILALQNDNTKEAIELRNQLEQDNLRLQSELRKNEGKVSFEQQLQRDGILNGYQLSQMEKGHGFNMELAKHREVLSRESQALQNEFTAAQAVLDRAQRENLQLSDQEFRRQMQEEMQKFTSDQSEIDRAIAAAQRKIDNAFTAAADARGERQLDLAVAAQELDEKYKLGSLALDELAANATKLGSEAKTATINYLTNDARLDAYANGTLQDKTTFDQLVLDYLNPDNNKVWNADLGAYVQGSTPQLADKVLQAIKAGDQAFYNRIIKMADPSLKSQVATGDTKKLNTLANANAQNSDIINSDGTLNPDSQAWTLTRPNRFNPETPYAQVIGLSRLYPGLVTMASEGYAELKGGVPTEAATAHKEAQKDLTALANDMLTFSSQLQEDRMLKFVQQLIEKESEALRPGGLLLRTDADAKATLEALIDGFAQGIQEEASKLPEYGGDSSFYTEKQVTSARSRVNKMKVFVNELLAFRKAFGAPVTSSTVTETGGDQSLSTAKSQIRTMMKQNTDPSKE